MSLAYALTARPGLGARIAARIDPSASAVVAVTRNGLTVAETAQGAARPDTVFAIGALAGIFAQASVLQLIQTGAVDLPLHELNTCPTRLAWLVEAAAGEPYAAYVARRLFRPAGMTASAAGPGGARATARDLAAFLGALSAGRLMEPSYARWFLHARPAWDAEAPGFSGALRLVDDGEAAVAVLAHTPGASALADAAAGEV